MIRSKLFVPASRPELFEKAALSAADALSFDLEDAVLESQKDQARHHLSQFKCAEKLIIVRINGVDTPHWQADLEATDMADWVNLPKVESLAQIEQVVALKPNVQLLLTIETPKGLRLAAELAAHPRVVGLQAGLVDLFERLSMDRHLASVREQILLQLRLAAGESNILCLDAAYPNVKDPAGFEQEARFTKRLGYAGKSCIHPSQIALANEIFSASAAELTWAKRILAAAELNTHGAFLLDGKMIDKPFIDSARRLLNA